jgi:hypothetical protein
MINFLKNFFIELFKVDPWEECALIKWRVCKKKNKCIKYLKYKKYHVI